MPINALPIQNDGNDAISLSKCNRDADANVNCRLQQCECWQGCRRGGGDISENWERKRSQGVICQILIRNLVQECRIQKSDKHDIIAHIPCRFDLQNMCNCVCKCVCVGVLQIIKYSFRDCNLNCIWRNRGIIQL